MPITSRRATPGTPLRAVPGALLLSGALRSAGCFLLAACLLLAPGLLLAPAAAEAQDAEGTRLLREPTVSDTRIAFVYAGDIWSVDRDGGDPRRLTADPAEEGGPHFSPDGRWIAFNVDHGGNTEVHVMPAEGGTPTRLTWHPGADRVTGWSADGSRITFASRREVGNGRSLQLWEVAPTGGAPTKVMEAPYLLGEWNGERLAYMPFMPAYNGLYGGGSGWKNYRGGTTPSIHVLDTGAGALRVIPGDRVNDIEPMWDGVDLYFVSDREGAFDVYRWDAGTGGAAGTARRLTDEAPWDVRSADAHDGVVVYEAGGRLKELDLASGAVRELTVTLNADLPQTRIRWVDASRTIESVALSRSGARAVITARGEVFTVPTGHGSTRNLTRTDGRREYTGLWSPDGGRVAYVIQEDGGQTLALADQRGLEPPRTFPLGTDFHQLLGWGGDHVAYADNRLNLSVIDVTSGRRTRIATHTRRAGWDVSFSPDGRWLAYTLERPNYFADLMLRDLREGTTTRLTDGMADISEVHFSPDGAYLFFGGSTNSGPSQVGLDLSSQEQNLRVGFYAVVLASDGESPLAPRTGDEEVEDDEPGNGGDGNGDRDGDGRDAGDGDRAGIGTSPTRIDLDGIARRIVSLPIPERNYYDLVVAKDGDLLFIDAVQPGAAVTPQGQPTQAENALMRWDFEERELSRVTADVTGVTMSPDGSHLVVRTSRGALRSGAVGSSIELEPLDVSGMRMQVDPRAEWAQIFDDAARMQPAFFYDENMHGLDWDAVVARYRELLPHVGRREDLNDVIVEMIAELSVGHNRAGGGDVYRPDEDAPAGLLGADFRAEDGRWRIVKILDGGSWNPFLHAPLARPGLAVEEGDYVIAVNGVDITTDDDLFRHLQGTAGVQTTLTVSSDARGTDARSVVVEPTGNENQLRLWDWVETRRARVDEATDGRVGYVYLPNTTTAGYRFFNRMFFAQVDRDALIIDERSNGGGQAANYFIDVLSRPYLSGWMDRDGRVFTTPGGAIHGPKVMLIDQDAGSGGDYLPWAFRREGVGTLIGTRTWGGLIGISANPGFVDGGGMVVPFFRFFTPEGEWAVENEGVAPDIEVPLDPVAFNRGVDVQLERAIQEILDQLEEYTPVVPTEGPRPPGRLGH